MAVTCITANLQHSPSALEAALAESPTVLFAQEAPADCAGVLGDYDVFEYRATDSHPAYVCRSFVAVRYGAGLDPHPVTMPTARYHRSYLAAASIAVPGLGRVTLVSVHASPREISEDSPYRDDWPAPTPTSRDAGRGELWDSDFVLDTITSMVGHPHDEVLVAGDINEARTGTSYEPDWAIEWFARADESGLHDVTYQQWSEERPTHGSAQLDHVLATEGLERQITGADILDSIGSDHLPIRFTIG